MALARPGSRDRPSNLELLKLFVHHKHDGGQFWQSMANRAVADLGLPVEGRRILDVGCGTGHNAEALEAAGADVVTVDLDPAVVHEAARRMRRPMVADGAVLPVSDATFDAVYCSNMLEHTPDTRAVLCEVERVLRPGGWAWISWTNWYSPWGGHEIIPFHYLGPRFGLATSRKLRGEPAKNVPFDGLWPVHIGTVLRLVRNRPSLRLVDALPRYYPSQRWIVRVPVLREVLTWNCVLVLERLQRQARE